MSDNYTPDMWQARPAGHGFGWIDVSPTKQQPTIDQRLDYLRKEQRTDGTPAYEFRRLVASTPLTDAAPEMLALLKVWVESFADSIEGGETEPLVCDTRSAIDKAERKP